MGINEILRKKFKFGSLNEKTGEKLYRPLFFPQEQMSRVVLRYKGKPISKGKVRVNIYLDADVVAYFRTKAGGRGYQALINKALKASIRKHKFTRIQRPATSIVSISH